MKITSQDTHKERVVGMVDTRKLKGLIVEKGFTQRDVAIYVGISQRSFYNKMKKGVFNTDEVMRMMDFLNIKNPEIFFTHKVT